MLTASVAFAGGVGADVVAEAVTVPVAGARWPELSVTYAVMVSFWPAG